MLSFDLPIPAIESNEGVFLFTIDEFGTNVRGTNEGDNCTFVLLRETEPGRERLYIAKLHLSNHLNFHLGAATI